jgi:hypothetical protein
VGEDTRHVLACGRETGEVASLAGFRGGCGIDLRDRRRHLRDEDPVLGAADERPAALGGASRVDEVAVPQRVRRRRPIDRHGML